MEDKDRIVIEAIMYQLEKLNQSQERIKETLRNIEYNTSLNDNKCSCKNTTCNNKQLLKD